MSGVMDYHDELENYRSIRYSNSKSVRDDRRKQEFHRRNENYSSYRENRRSPPPLELNKYSYSNENKAKLEVSNLSYRTRNADLFDLFSEYGKLKNVEVHYDNDKRALGTAEVAFSSSQDAVKAVDHCDGMEFQGRKLKIKFFKGTAGDSYKQNNRDNPEYSSSSRRDEGGYNNRYRGNRDNDFKPRVGGNKFNYGENRQNSERRGFRPDFDNRRNNSNYRNKYQNDNNSNDGCGYKKRRRDDDDNSSAAPGPHSPIEEGSDSKKLCEGVEYAPRLVPIAASNPVMDEEENWD